MTIEIVVSLSKGQRIYKLDARHEHMIHSVWGDHLNLCLSITWPAYSESAVAPGPSLFEEHESGRIPSLIIGVTIEEMKRAGFDRVRYLYMPSCEERIVEL